MGLLHLHETPELCNLETKPSPIFAIKIKEKKEYFTFVKNSQT